MTLRRLIISFFLTIAISVHAQENALQKTCIQYFDQEYFLNEDYNQLSIKGDKKARFHITLHEHFVHRIAATSSLNNAPLEITLYDKEDHVLFCNREHNFIPYWDFKVASTIECIVEVQLVEPRDKRVKICLMTGYKKE